MHRRHDYVRTKRKQSIKTLSNRNANHAIIRLYNRITGRIIDSTRCLSSIVWDVFLYNYLNCLNEIIVWETCFTIEQRFCKHTTCDLYAFNSINKIRYIIAFGIDYCFTRNFSFFVFV